MPTEYGNWSEVPFSRTTLYTAEAVLETIREDVLADDNIGDARAMNQARITLDRIERESIPERLEWPRDDRCGECGADYDPKMDECPECGAATEQGVVSPTQVLVALRTLQKMKRCEADTDHRRSLDRVIDLLIGVYDLEMEADAIGKPELDNVERVLTAIDPDDQSYADAETAEREQERGLEWVEVYRPHQTPDE